MFVVPLFLFLEVKKKSALELCGTLCVPLPLEDSTEQQPPRLS